MIIFKSKHPHLFTIRQHQTKSNQPNAAALLKHSLGIIFNYIATVQLGSHMSSTFQVGTYLAFFNFSPAKTNPSREGKNKGESSFFSWGCVVPYGLGKSSKLSWSEGRQKSIHYHRVTVCSFGCSGTLDCSLRSWLLFFFCRFEHFPVTLHFAAAQHASRKFWADCMAYPLRVVSLLLWEVIFFLSTYCHLRRCNVDTEKENTLQKKYF